MINTKESHILVLNIYNVSATKKALSALMSVDHSRQKRTCQTAAIFKYVKNHLQQGLVFHNLFCTLSPGKDPSGLP